MEKGTLAKRSGRIFNNAELGAEKIILVNTGSPDPNFLYVTGFTCGLADVCYLLLVLH